MTSSWKERIYPFLPIFLQNVACSLEGRNQRRLRYGGDFHELLDWLEESQWWSAAKIQSIHKTAIRSSSASSPCLTTGACLPCELKPPDIRSSDDLQDSGSAQEDVTKHILYVSRNSILNLMLFHQVERRQSLGFIRSHAQPNSVGCCDTSKTSNRFEHLSNVQGFTAVPLDHTSPFLARKRPESTHSQCTHCSIEDKIYRRAIDRLLRLLFRFSVVLVVLSGLS